MKTALNKFEFLKSNRSFEIENTKNLTCMDHKQATMLYSKKLVKM
jgi:hypothetical protein